MEWSEWKPTYDWICGLLHIDPADDARTTALLTELLRDVRPEPLLHQLQGLITGRTVVVCGAGPSLERHLNTVADWTAHDDITFIAADGATSAFEEMGLHCDIVVTDLDGNVDDIAAAKSKGAVVVVHAHGDNMPTVQRELPRLGHVLGSTQTKPTGRAHLWGGFTDGDRACYMAAHYSPRQMVLAGMDFGSLVGRWSKPGYREHFVAGARKRIKLEIARRLIEELIHRTAPGIDYSTLQ